MGNVIKYLNRIVAAGFAIVSFSLPLTAEESRLDALLGDLAMAPPQEAQRIAAEIEMEWAKSGSAAMDLLLRRGEDALEAGDFTAAVEHLSAAIDHAPDFAEAWHLRSIAFFRQGRFGLALHDIEQALTLEPRHFNAIYGLGVLLDEMGRPDLAREALLRAQSIHPHHKDISGTLERVSRKLGGADL
jgi:Flp pilus assembly protein TadD